MSLDCNLFTLLLTPQPPQSPLDFSVVDLVDPASTVHYRKRRLAGDVYKAELYEPVSGSLLASVTAPSATNRHKTIELFNPAQVVELRYTGQLWFCWAFKWESHEFEWRREKCFMLRKPDPPVLVALTNEGRVQVLDYNLNRFDIEDRKGLEIVILFALLSFQDVSDAHPDPGAAGAPATPVGKGAAGIAELQRRQGRVRGETNEVGVEAAGAAGDYAAYCVQLLKDEAMLYISVCAVDAAQVQKVLQVVDETIRMRHKAGDAKLHQYVRFDADADAAPASGSGLGPRAINLDDVPSRRRTGKEHSQPRSLTVHLSKIDMPELHPSAAAAQGSGRLRKANTQREPARGLKSQLFGSQSKRTSAVAERPPVPARPPLPTLGQPQPGTVSAKVQRLLGLI